MRSVVLNIEANGLRPKEIWCCTTLDVDTGEERIFLRPELNPEELNEYASSIDVVIGHNIIWYDLPVLKNLVHSWVAPGGVVDTLVVSRLLNFDRSGGHSLKNWAGILGLPKGEQPPWTEFSQALVDHSLENIRTTLAVYKHLLPYLNSKRWRNSIDLEHFIAQELYTVKDNGFHFDVDKARKLRYDINKEVEQLDANLLDAFKPRVQLIREVTPRLTKHGTLNRNDFRWVADGDLSCFNGGPFSLIEYVEFNPGSPVQIVERLNEAGWKPVEKTKGHLQAIREKNEEKLARMKTTGWKVSETNLDTLPETAPEAAKSLAKRIKYASRVRVLDEWLANTQEDSRIHGSINHIGAWSHRCSHDHPNTGNIPRDDAVFGREMRELWGVDNGYLVGVDAESIQLRVLAHYINDPRFTHALCEGKKEDGTDPHSLNKIALGEVCKSRNVSKTFIYAWLLGAGIGKVSEILECSYTQAKAANDSFLEFYPGLRELKRERIPYDAARGYFEGFDGRLVKIFGDDASAREHFALAGYLQGGEAIVMKVAMSIWIPQLRKERIPFRLVNFVHDEWQTQVPDYDTGVYVGNIQALAIKEAGETLKLRCPMAGSVLSGHGGIAIGQNWYETH